MERTYRRYESPEYSARWSSLNAGNRRILEERVALARSSCPSVGPGAVVIDLGAGSTVSFPGLHDDSTILRTDLLLHRLVHGHNEAADGLFVCADGAALPYRDASASVVVASTLFSSVVNRAVQEHIGGEVTRVLKSGGFVLWYDMRLPNPGNKKIVSVRLNDMRRIFPTLVVDVARSCTVLPPLTRRLGGATGRLYGPLARIPPVRSHLLAVLRKP